LRIRAIQEPVFSVANTDFEDGDDDHGYGDCIFLVIYAQPSHRSRGQPKKPEIDEGAPGFGGPVRI
jgi:hypothetical protein